MPGRAKKKPEWKREVAAGGVIFHGRGKAARILLIKDSYGRWALPKGIVERGETPEEAALRECSEETGIARSGLRLVEKLGDVKYVYQLHGKKIFKVVTFYLIESAGTALKPQWEIQDARWFEPGEAAEKIEYGNAKQIVKAAIEKARRM